MRIFAGALYVTTTLAFALLATTAAHAQGDHDWVCGESCADVKPPAVNPADTLAGVPVYMIPECASSTSNLETTTRCPGPGRPRFPIPSGARSARLSAKVLPAATPIEN
jgi:hypothetical protein